MSVRITEKKIVSFDGGKLWVKTYQNAPDWRVKRQVVLVHGVANNLEIWEPLINELLVKVPRLKCIAYDLRGHGRSTKKFSHLTGTRLELVHALDLQVLLEKEALWRPILVGHSLGGIVIQEWLNLTGMGERGRVDGMAGMGERLGGKRRLKWRGWWKRLEWRWWRWRLRPREIFLIATNVKTRQIKGLNRQKIMELFAKMAKSERRETKVLKMDHYLERTAKNDFNWQTILRTARSLPMHGSLLHWLGLMNWENERPENLAREKVTLFYGENDKFFGKKEVEETLKKWPTIKGIEVKGGQHGLTTSNYEEIAKVVDSTLEN